MGVIDNAVKTAASPVTGYNGGGTDNISAGVGGFFSDMNPFKKPGVPDVPDVIAPDDITAPKLAANAKQASVGSMPRPMTGGNIAIPLPGQINMANSSFRDNQVALVNQLSNQAAGVGPSVAGEQLRVGQEAALAATMAQANSMRGGANPGMARAAMQTGAEMQGRAAQEAATARMQEQMTAAGLLGQVTGQSREGDLQQAGLQNQAKLEIFKGNLDAQIAQGQLDQATAETIYKAEVDKRMKDADLQANFQALQAQYAAMGLDAATANQQAALQVESLKQSGALGVGNMAMQADASQKGMIGGLFGAAGAVGAGIATKSDVRAKEDIVEGDSAIRALLDSVTPYEYSYKDEKHGKGRFVSPMAQDLLKTEVGASMVFNDDEGQLSVDYGKGFGALLAAQASLNKRLAKIEKKKKAS